MRPIERGGCPLDAAQKPRVFMQYSEARDELLSRLGAYCSYCEMPIQNLPAVEHIQPKTWHPGLTLSWDNFLLGCASCNSNKHNKNVVLADYYWPDRDNTARAIAYPNEASIVPGSGLQPSEQIKAQRTIELTGLDRLPGAPRPPTDKDQRWRRRQQAWGRAREAKTLLDRCNRVEMRVAIVQTAEATGFFSVWMAVFEHDADMRRRLIDAFPGTSRPCFDADSRPCARPGGAL